MADSGFTLVQSRFGGPFDSSLAEKLLPFLVATMDHEKRPLRTKAQEMWHATFANSLRKTEIPKDVAGILRKSLLLSSESSQGGSSRSDSRFSTFPIARIKMGNLGVWDLANRDLSWHF